jgi:hypothetical protein
MIAYGHTDPLLIFSTRCVKLKTLPHLNDAVPFYTAPVSLALSFVLTLLF